MQRASKSGVRFTLIDGDLISDGVHPNQRGMIAVATLMANELKKFIYSYKVN